MMYEIWVRGGGTAATSGGDDISMKALTAPKEFVVLETAACSGEGGRLGITQMTQIEGGGEIN